MNVMNIIDRSDYKTSYGMLLCDNDMITTKDIQEKIIEITQPLENANEEWWVEDVINNLPIDWNVKYIKNIDYVTI